MKMAIVTKKIAFKYKDYDDFASINTNAATTHTPSALSSEPFRIPGALAISPRKMKLSSSEISTNLAPRYEWMRLLL
jgi:hypothetical protein